MTTVLRPDVAIVGGGVAGSSLAATLADAGLAVVVVEREARFRDRVRGEGIHPWGVREVERLGLRDVLHEAGAHNLPAWTSWSAREPVFSFRWDDGDPGWPGELAIEHPTLQATLLEHARARGAAVLRPARIHGFRRDPEPVIEVDADGDTYALRPRLIVGADGRQSLTRRWLGARTIVDPPHHEIGGCLLDGVALDDGSSHDAGFSGGFALAFPLGAERARVYLVGQDAVTAPLRRDPEAFVARCAALWPEGAFADARASGPLAFFPNADIWADRVAGDGIALVGDAAGANDPTRGQGLSIAFRDVREMRDRLLADDDWEAALAGYAAARMRYYEVLRVSAQWVAMRMTETGPEADARQAGHERAREHDPDLGGFGLGIVKHGSDGLVADEAARRHYFGEDLPDSA